MKAWHAVLAAAWLLDPQASTAADDLASAARELARKTSAWARGPLTATYRNLSSLPDSELDQVRREFEAGLEVAAGNVIETRITLSENATQFLLVEEARKGEESQVWIASWMRSPRPPASLSGVALDKKLVWEQDDPILDVAFPAEGMLVLSSTRLTLYQRQGEEWKAQQVVRLVPPKPWPRDPRGRLRLTGARLQAFLPGMLCNGSTEPAFSLGCAPSDEPWVLESGSRGILLANFAAGRNYFDGRVVAQNGLRKSVAPFYSAAEMDESSGVSWLLAQLDGRTQILDAALEPVASIPAWGSDIVGIDSKCVTGSPVLATRPGDASEPDAVQAFTIGSHAAASLGSPVTFPGPVTALWPSTPVSAMAVARDLTTGKYAAYVLTLVCGS